MPPERGVSVTKIFKGMYKPKLVFPEGLGQGRYKPKVSPWEGYTEFPEQHSETI